MAGRPRKPLELHLVQGTARTTRFAEQRRDLEPQVREKLKGAPDWLPDAVREEWARKLKETPWLKATDEPAFFAYCVMRARIDAKVRDGDDISPAEWAAFRSYCQSFGFDPQSRAKIQMDAPEKPVNSFAALG